MLALLKAWKRDASRLFPSKGVAAQSSSRGGWTLSTPQSGHTFQGALVRTPPTRRQSVKCQVQRVQPAQRHELFSGENSRTPENIFTRRSDLGYRQQMIPSTQRSHFLFFLSLFVMVTTPTRHPDGGRIRTHALITLFPKCTYCPFSHYPLPISGIFW
jgi:hypothetical protein